MIENVEDKEGLATSGIHGYFQPQDTFPFGIITISPTREWEGFPCWKREYLALLIHEIVHAYDWVVTYKKDTESWNNNGAKIEERAYKVQDNVLHFLGVSW